MITSFQMRLDPADEGLQHNDAHQSRPGADQRSLMSPILSDKNLLMTRIFIGLMIEISITITFCSRFDSHEGRGFFQAFNFAIGAPTGTLDVVRGPDGTIHYLPTTAKGMIATTPATTVQGTIIGHGDPTQSFDKAPKENFMANTPAISHESPVSSMMMSQGPHFQ